MMLLFTRLLHNSGTWMVQSSAELRKARAFHTRVMRCLHRRAYGSISDDEVLDQIDAPGLEQHL
eukprot:4887101-Alexandrium_andersonii.AAC.1